MHALATSAVEKASMREVDIKLKEKELEGERRRLKEAREILANGRKKEQEMKVRTNDLVVP